MPRAVPARHPKRRPPTGGSFSAVSRLGYDVDMGENQPEPEDDLPNDADGDALRRLQADGSDLSKEMEIDFAVVVPDRKGGEAFAVVARQVGFATNVYHDEEGAWTCYCTRTMVPTYDAMIAVQESLAEMGRPFNAFPDGWGSFGNADEG
jgi:Regulator of ribonuclease activity B